MATTRNGEIDERGRAGAGAPAALTIAVPCRADEPALGATLDALGRAAAACRAAGREVALAVCVNGPGAPSSPAMRAARDFAASAGIGPATLLAGEVADKATAWNALCRAAETPLVAFCDADVEVDPGAIEALADALDRQPDRLAATARRVAVGAASPVARAASLPARFDLGVLCGACYAVRRGAAGEMPPGLLLEDAWLSARLGRDRIAVVPGVAVRYRPAATLADLFGERLRTEAGKLQLRALRRAGSLPPGPIARYPWRAMLRGLGPADVPPLALGLAVRCAARVVAEVARAAGRPIPWRQVGTSKGPARPR